MTRPLATLVLGAIVVAGCRSADTDAADRAAELRWEVLEAAIAAEAPAERSIGWAEAVDLLAARGPGVLRANDAVERAERAADRPYRRLIPQIDMRYGIIEQIGDLGSPDSDALRFDVFLTNLLAGLFDLPTNLYAARLAVVRAHLMREQAWREQVIEMHALFASSRALEERARLTALAIAAAERISETSTDTARELETLRETERELRLRHRDLADRMGELLGVPIVEFRPNPADLPEIDGVSIASGPMDEVLMESIALRVLATELVGLDARVRGAELEYWPQPEQFLSTPALYTQQGDESSDFDLGEITISARLRLTIDLQGQFADRIADAKLDRAAALREARRVVARAAATAVRVEERVLELDREREQARAKLAMLSRAAATDGPTGLRRRLAEAARARTDVARAELDELALIAPLLTLDEVWQRAFTYADSRTPGRTPDPTRPGAPGDRAGSGGPAGGV
jgi:hypothetical protein